MLDVLTRPSFGSDARRVGALLADGLDELAAVSSYVSWSRGMGMMLGFDIVDPHTDRPADRELCGSLFRRCRDSGLLLAADVPRVRLSPPLTLSDEEAEQALEILFEVLA